MPDVITVCCSLRYEHRAELIELRRCLETYAEAAKTMGIPLLYPWANRLDRLGYAAAGLRVRPSAA